jgi:hypothetical protein
MGPETVLDVVGGFRIEFTTNPPAMLAMPNTAAPNFHLELGKG